MGNKHGNQNLLAVLVTSSRVFRKSPGANAGEFRDNREERSRRATVERTDLFGLALHALGRAPSGRRSAGNSKARSHIQRLRPRQTFGCAKPQSGFARLRRRDRNSGNYRRNAPEWTGHAINQASQIRRNAPAPRAHKRRGLPR